MNKRTFVSLLLILCAAPATASTITLPDSGTYYYWIRGTAGSIDEAPHKTSGSSTITLPKAVLAGGTLYVLDNHTGEIAAVPIAANAPITVTIDDFHSVEPPASSTPVSTSATPAAAIQSQSAPPPTQSTASRIFSSILGLLLLGAVIWFVRKLYISRGQLLIDAARKVGVEVPNPDDPIPGAVTKDGKYEPPPIPKVQRIPDAAFKSAIVAPTNGFLIAADGTSYGIGKKPLTIGRDSDNDIVLNDASVSRHHARVEPMEGGAQLIDQNSSNGVFVNGDRIQTAELQTATQLSIGQVPMRYER